MLKEGDKLACLTVNGQRFKFGKDSKCECDDCSGCDFWVDGNGIIHTYVKEE